MATRSCCACYVQAELEHARSERAAAEVGSHHIKSSPCPATCLLQDSINKGFKISVDKGML